MDNYKLDKTTRNPTKNNLLRKYLIPTLNRIVDLNSNTPSLEYFSLDYHKESKPAIIVVAGGAYLGRDKYREGIDIAAYFTRMGFAAFILNYSVSPYTFPTPILDGINAVNFIREKAGYFKINPNKIGMIGFSAGGHLVSSVSSGVEIEGSKANLNFQILCYPLIDMARNSIRMNFVKQVVYNKGEYDAFLDSSKLIGEHTPSTFIWHSKKDIIVPYDHSLKYINSLKQKNINYQSRIYPDGSHGIGLGDKNKRSHSLVSNWSNECEKWLKQIGVL